MEQVSFASGYLTIMSILLLASITLISLALVFYSLGVWAEHISRYLKLWHVFTFWVGLFYGHFFSLSNPSRKVLYA